MYAKLNDGKIDQYPYTVTELKTDNPLTSFPFDPLNKIELREAFNIIEIQENPKPEYNPQTHKCIEKNPVHKNGKWDQVWETKEKSSSEKTEDDLAQWNQIRNQRNQKIQETDWEMVKALEKNDDATDLKTYRQSLRDIPQTQTNPFSITWPEKP